MVRIPKVAFYTFGCKVNLFETEQLKESLKNIEIVSPEEDADFYIINSCTVTSATDSQVRNMIRRLSKKGKVIVTGCGTRKEYSSMPEDADALYLNSIEKVASFFESEILFAVDFSRARPFLKIEDGCDQFCTYCIIPYVRGGKIKSVPMSDISKVLDDLKNKDFNEVVLTGIHIGRYGKDNNYRETLADVANLAFEKIGRVRLGSMECLEISEKLFEMAEEGKVLPHWHISLQSGSDSILKKMNRPYPAEDFAKAVMRLTDDGSNSVAVGTDVIVGFPGETDEDFMASFNLIKKLPLAYGHVFPFSPRKGTKGYELEKKESVPSDIKKERARKMRELFEVKRREYIDKCDGLVTTMILEEEKGKNHFSGTAANYLTVDYFGEGVLKECKTIRIRVKDGRLWTEKV